MHFRHRTRGKDAPVSMGWCVRTYWMYTWLNGASGKWPRIWTLPENEWCNADLINTVARRLWEWFPTFFFFFWVCMFSLYLLSSLQAHQPPHTVQRHIRLPDNYCEHLDVRQWCQWKSGSVRNKLDNTNRCVIVLAVTCACICVFGRNV